MKVVAVNSSPRKESNTAMLIDYVFEPLRAEGIDTELIRIGNKKIWGCRACYKCFQNQDRHCSVKDDVVNDCIDQLAAAGIPLEKGPESHENGRFAWIMDPDGNKVELWEPMPWDDANKEL